MICILVCCSGKAVAILYFLKNTITDQASNIGEPKEFIMATDVVYAYTNDNIQVCGWRVIIYRYAGGG